MKVPVISYKGLICEGKETRILYNAMRNMIAKREGIVISIGFLLAIILSLSACGPGQISDSTTPTSETPAPSTLYAEVSNGVYVIQVIEVERTSTWDVNTVPEDPDDIFIVVTYETTDPALLAEDLDISECGELRSSTGQYWEATILVKGRGVINGEQVASNTCVFVVPKTAVGLSFVVNGYPPVPINFN